MRKLISAVLHADLSSRAVHGLRAAKAVGRSTAFAEIGDVLADELEDMGTVEIAEALEAEGVPHPTVSLRRVEAWMHRVLAARRRAGEVPELAHARRLVRHGTELFINQEFSRSAAVTEEAVTILRQLEALHVGMHAGDLAGALGNLSDSLFRASRYPEAIAAATEAVEILRATSSRQSSLLSTVADCLRNKARILLAMSDPEGARDTSEEAVNIFRELAARNPNEFLPGLALALNGQMAALGTLGDADGAFSAGEEALAILDGLASRHPDSYVHKFAEAVMNFGGTLRMFGRLREAIDATSHSVEICRSLVARDPDVFLPDLARGLVNLGLMLTESGSAAKALGPAREAVSIWRVVSAKDRRGYLADLALSQYNLSNTYARLGEVEKSISWAEDAVVSYRELVVENPGMFDAQCAALQNNLANRLSELGRNERVVEMISEALDLMWPQFVRLPRVNIVNTEIILLNLRRRHEQFGADLPIALLEREALFAEISTQLERDQFGESSTEQT